MVGKRPTLHHCVSEHICSLINWSGQAHLDFGNRSGLINESSIPEKARTSPYHFTTHLSEIPVTLFRFFRDRCTRVELSVLFPGRMRANY